MKSGAEQTGAPNQPRSKDGGAAGTKSGTTGSGMTAPDTRPGATRDGTNANVKPSSPNADVPSGAPAPKPRGQE
jgi:hypothetical protein